MNLMILAALFCGIAVLFHVFSIVAAAIRCKTRARPLPPPVEAPPVTIIRPVCGVENHITETLQSTFKLDYPDYEIIFCAASAKDPIVPIVEELLRKNPRARARLLLGDERVSTNPKLNNCVKGWRAAAHDWIVIADSNVLMPPDYIQRLLACWKEDTGLVCAPPIGAAVGRDAPSMPSLPLSPGSSHHLTTGWRCPACAPWRNGPRAPRRGGAEARTHGGRRSEAASGLRPCRRHVAGQP